MTYLLLAWLTIEIAIGHPHRQASDTGAFELLASHAWGVALLLIMAIGFAGYAAWSLTCALGELKSLKRRRPQPAKNTPEEAKPYAKDGAKRIAALWRAVLYGFLCYLAFKLATGAGHGSSGDPAPLAARAMSQPAGQIVVAAAGAAVIITGLVLIWHAARRKFMGDMRTEDMTTSTRRALGALGLAGSIARGIVVALVGVFLLVSGVTHRPSKAKGLDASLVTLAHQPYGPVLLVGVAAGLAVFGVFSVLESRYVQT